MKIELPNNSAVETTEEIKRNITVLLMALWDNGYERGHSDGLAEGYERAFTDAKENALAMVEQALRGTPTKA